MFYLKLDLAAQFPFAPTAVDGVYVESEVMTAIVTAAWEKTLGRVDRQVAAYMLFRVVSAYAPPCVHAATNLDGIFLAGEPTGAYDFRDQFFHDSQPLSTNGFGLFVCKDNA